MSRLTLIAEIDAYDAVDGRERAMADEVRAFVLAVDDCFERTHLGGHITASAWIVDEQREHALLTHHRKLNRWLQLGGHADGDTDVRRVALREAIEESGLTAIRFASAGIFDIDVHRIPAGTNEPEHKHYDVRFAFIADRTAPLIVSDESHELAWRLLAELDRDDTDESVRRMARKTMRLR